MTKTIVTDSQYYVPDSPVPENVNNINNLNGDITSRLVFEGWQKSRDDSQYGDITRIKNMQGRAKAGVNYTFAGASGRVITLNAATYNITDTQTLLIKVDGGAAQTITFSTSAFPQITSGAATAAQVAAAVSFRIVGAQAIVVAGGDSDYVKITSDTYGLSSSIEIVGGTASAVLGFQTGIQYGEPGAVPAVFVPGSTDGSNRSSPYNITNGMTLIVSVNGLADQTITFSTGGGTPITSGAATWQEVIAAINAVAVGFKAYPDFDPILGVRIGYRGLQYGSGTLAFSVSGTANTALGLPATGNSINRTGADGTNGDGRQKAWIVHHQQPNNATTSVEHDHWSLETDDSEGKARTRFEFKFLADVCRAIFNSCYLVLNDVNMYISAAASNRDIWFTSNVLIQNKYRLAGIRSRAAAATGNGRAVGSVGDLTIMTTDTAGNPGDVAICHRGANRAMSMRSAIMELQSTSSAAAVSNLTTSPSAGNALFLTGATAVNTIVRTGWQAGAKLTIHWAAAATFSINSAATDSDSSLTWVRLNGGVSFAPGAGGNITLQLLWTPGSADPAGWYWREVSRSTA